MDTYVSVSEAARIKKVTRQAVYLAIRMKRLKAYKHGENFRIFLTDLDAYDKQRYSRATSVFKGERIFDDEKGSVSMDKASQMLAIPKQKLYYAARTGKLRAHRKGACWVVFVRIFSSTRTNS